MRHLIMITLLTGSMGLTACGKGYKAAGQASSESNTENSVSGISNVSYSADADTAKNISFAISQSFLNIITYKLEGSLALNANQANAASTLNSTVNCPDGGTVTVNSHVSLSASANLTGANSSFTQDSSLNSDVDYAECKFKNLNGEEVTLDGDLVLDQLGGGATASINLGGTSTLVAQGTHQAHGNLHVIIGSNFDHTCAYVYNGNFSAQGSLNVTNFSATGTATAKVTGTICGQAVDDNQTLNWN